MDQVAEPIYSAPWIARHYGALVSTEALAKLLAFPTAAAVRRAVAEERLALKLHHVPGRRGVFASAADVAEYLAELPMTSGGQPMS